MLTPLVCEDKVLRRGRLKVMEEKACGDGDDDDGGDDDDDVCEVVVPASLW